jgi:hypothetical protein
LFKPEAIHTLIKIRGQENSLPACLCPDQCILSLLIHRQFITSFIFYYYLTLNSTWHNFDKELIMDFKEITTVMQSGILIFQAKQKGGESILTLRIDFLCSIKNGNKNENT